MFYTEIDLVQAARSLNDDEYVDYIFALFQEADESQVSLIKRMWDSMYPSDKDEVLEYMNKQTK
jgi:hypothetical protein